jgi:hypothetical protein
MAVSPPHGRGDDKEVVMATRRARSREDGADRIIDSLAEAERTALEAVRRFLDTVNSSFPDVGPDGGARQRIIDSAFKMTDELVGTSNEFAHRLVKVGSEAAQRAPAARVATRKSVARKSAARKSAARKAPARKAPAKKAVAKKAPAKRAPVKKAAVA